MKGRDRATVRVRVLHQVKAAEPRARPRLAGLPHLPATTAGRPWLGLGRVEVRDRDRDRVRARARVRVRLRVRVRDRDGVKVTDRVRVRVVVRVRLTVTVTVLPLPRTLRGGLRPSNQRSKLSSSSWLGLRAGLRLGLGLG